MRGVNKAILIGRLGKDPEIRYTAGGAAIANITLATSETWKDKQSGDQVEKTEWHRVVFFGRLAEIVGEYLKKGAPIYVEGRIQTRKWQDKDGQDKYTTEIVGNEMQMLGSKGDAPAAMPAGGGSMDDVDASQSAPSDAPSAKTAENMATDDFDDDIPF